MTPPERRGARRPPLVVVPLMVYAGVTLIAPALRGAHRAHGFVEHAAIVAIVTAAFGSIWLWRDRAAGRRRSKRRPSPRAHGSGWPSWRSFL